MAFCTQRKFPGQSYENSGLAEINKMKAYSSIKDHRAWSIDQNQQTSYLVEAVHKGDVDLQRTMTIGLSRCKSEIKKTSKRVGTADVDQHSSITNQSDSLQIFELSMELEDTKLKNSTLKSENADLRKRIANIMASDHEHEQEENMHNHLQILEQIISERNDLRELLDKFLDVTDQIVDLKIQADKTKNIESDFVLLQTQFRDQQMELEALRKEKETFEERIQGLQTTQAEANALKESNSKLEKDLSEVISVSNNFIHDKENEIETKLHTITELNEQIGNLKRALSEAEKKLDKKLRLEMDVELMEKELSMMIENSAESNPYHQQVEDLATAIKLTLDCMNYKFENNEENNLVAANRQLKALLLESSNKILEFKDVINKQEQNLKKVTNDFACKNDELTECLATVEELKRKIANREAKTTYKNDNTDTPNAQDVALPCTDNLPTVGIDEEQEIFENEINLADSPQVSEYEDDGREIEDLENIFEKSCRQQERYGDTSGLQGLKPNIIQSEELKLFKQMKTDSMPENQPDLPNVTEAGQCSFTTKPESCSAEHLRRLSVKVEHMSSYINDLESQNNELKSQIKQISSTGSRNVEIIERKNNERDKLKSDAISVVGDSHGRFKTNTDVGSVDASSTLTNKKNNEVKVQIKQRLSTNSLNRESINPMDNEQGVCAAPATVDANDEFSNMQHKLKDMISEINHLQETNQELMETIRMLQQQISLKPSPSKSTSKLINEGHHEQFSSKQSFDSVKRKEIQNEESKMESTSLLKEIDQLKNSENQVRLAVIPSEFKVLPSKDDSQKSTTAENENEKIYDKSTEKGNQLTGKDIQGPEFHELISTSEELRNANEQLLRKISFLERDAQNPWSPMQQGRLSTKSQQFESDILSSDVKRIENENLNLKLENEKLVVEIGKLKNLENSSHLSVLEMKKEMEKLTAINEQLAAELSAKKLEKDLLLVKEADTMPPDLRDLVLRNEELRKDNENLLLKIRCLEQAENSNRPKDSNLSEQNQVEDAAVEPDWLPSNEDLVAEIEKLQQSKNKSSLAIRQMEKDLKKMELVNENLSAQLTDKEAELQQLSMQPDVENILKQNEELKMLNRNLTFEISELKKVDNVRANEANIKEEMETLAIVNKTLMAEISELKQMALITNMKTDQQLRAIDTGLLSEMVEPISPQNSSHISILQIGKDLERLAALNESLLTLNDTDIDKKHSLLHGMAPDISQLLKKNQELKLDNENLTTKIRELQDTEHQAHFDAMETANQLKTLAAANEQLQARIKEMESFSSTDRATNLQSIKNENENLKTTNDKLIGQIALLEEKLQNIGNRTATQLNEQEPTATKGVPMPMHADSDLSLEIDWMVADMKKLQNRNEHLRSTNEKLLSQISELQSCVNRSNTRDNSKMVSDRVLDNKESDAQLIYACNRNIEIEWMKADMDALHKKNEKLKSTNVGLVAEIGTLKCSQTQTQKNMQQMEKDLLRLSAMNERLSTQVNEKRLDKKQLLKARSQELETKDLLKKIEELSTSNECLASEITELKGLDMVKMRNDLRKLSSTNDNLKMQIAELKLMSSNELKMESNWMAADMKKLFSKNKKLNISNQNLVNEINEMRREFKSLENRANVNALQKVKEVDRLTALNENLKDQLNAVKAEKKNCKCNEIGPDCSVANVKTLHKKNEELKAANEKLLSVIVNLKNAEKQASSKVAEFENELHKLRETNKSLQDTLENYVEKDWSIPKTELERICQSILNEGIYSLTDTEFHYMQNWFTKSASSEYDVGKTSRKSTTRKHCKICHNAVDAFGKTCECKQYEEKKRLHLLKEIEETKLAIQHIQKSNDIEFDLNDVKNRLLKTKPSDSDDDSQYDIRMSQSQGSVNVRGHIITKCVKRNHHVRK